MHLCRTVLLLLLRALAEVVIGTLFSDIGKTGPEDADAQGQQMLAEMYGGERAPAGDEHRAEVERA